MKGIGPLLFYVTKYCDVGLLGALAKLPCHTLFLIALLTIAGLLGWEVPQITKCPCSFLFDISFLNYSLLSNFVGVQGQLRDILNPS